MNSKLAVDYAMKKRAKASSKDKRDGGSGEDLDDMVMDDHLESHNSGADDGDDDGHSEEVKNEDMVGRIMRKRKGK